MIKIENKVYFDADCLSAFLWLNDVSSLVLLFEDDIVLPRGVYDELSKVPGFKSIIDNYLNKKLMSIVDIDFDSKEMEIYNKLTKIDNHYKVFGRGEAEVISHAVCKSKKMASNNLSDVEDYVKLYNLINYTIPDLLEMLIESGIKTIDEVELMWKNLKMRDTRIPGKTFNEYLSKYKKKKIG